VHYYETLIAVDLSAAVKVYCAHARLFISDTLDVCHSLKLKF